MYFIGSSTYSLQFKIKLFSTIIPHNLLGFSAGHRLELYNFRKKALNSFENLFSVGMLQLPISVHRCDDRD